MQNLVSALLGLYIPLAAGIMLRRLNLTSDTASRDLSRVVLYFLFPLLVFLAVSKRKITVEILLMPVLSMTLILICLTVSLLIFGKQHELILPASFHNAIYLPIPIAYALWGEEAVALISYYALGNILLFNLLVPLIAAGSLKKGLHNLARYPPFYALVLGIIASALSIIIPTEVEEALRGIGGATTPIAILVLGLDSAKNLVFERDSLKVMFIRFIVAPVATLILACMVFKLRDLPLAVVILESLMPPAVSNVIISGEFGLDSEKMARIVVVTTLFASIASPLLTLLFLKSLY